MKGAAGYMALVLAEAVAGSAVFLWCTPLWNEVKKGFFTLTTSIITVLALAAWWSTHVAAIPGDRCGAVVHPARARDRDPRGALVRPDARETAHDRAGGGLLSVPVSIAVLVAMAGTSRQSFALGVVPAAGRRGLPGVDHRWTPARPLVPHRPRAVPWTDQPHDQPDARRRGGRSRRRHLERVRGHRIVDVVEPARSPLVRSPRGSRWAWSAPRC